jgi:hypothetical protein
MQMNDFKLKLFQALLDQEDPYFIQVSSRLGAVELIYRDRELRLLDSTSTASWQDIILAEDATYHLRPGPLPSPSEGELIPATSLTPLMESAAEEPTPPKPPAEPDAPAKPIILKGSEAKNELQTSMYGSSEVF